MKKSSVFSTKMGSELAKTLAIHIARTEPVGNRDECIDEFRELVCFYSDSQAKAPVSALIKAEDRMNIKRRSKNERYYVSIHEELAEVAS